MTVMIWKLKPSYDEAYPPGWNDRPSNGDNPIPPFDFDGHTWLKQMPKAALYADIHPLIYNDPQMFTSKDIWRYATMPHEKTYEFDYEIGAYHVLRSGWETRIASFLVIRSNRYRKRAERVVAEIGRAGRDQQSLYDALASAMQAIHDDALERAMAAGRADAFYPRAPSWLYVFHPKTSDDPARYFHANAKHYL